MARSIPSFGAYIEEDFGSFDPSTIPPDQLALAPQDVREFHAWLLEQWPAVQRFATLDSWARSLVAGAAFGTVLTMPLVFLMPLFLVVPVGLVAAMFAGLVAINMQKDRVKKEVDIDRVRWASGMVRTWAALLASRADDPVLDASSAAGQLIARIQPLADDQPEVLDAVRTAEQQLAQLEADMRHLEAVADADATLVPVLRDTQERLAAARQKWMMDLATLQGVLLTQEHEAPSHDQVLRDALLRLQAQAEVDAVSAPPVQARAYAKQAS